MQSPGLGEGPALGGSTALSKAGLFKTTHVNTLGAALGTWNNFEPEPPTPPQPSTKGHGPCLQPLAPPSLAREEEGWRRKKRNLIAAEDQGERLLGRSLEKGRGKEITKKKEKINKNFTIWSQRVLIPSTKITQAALPNHPVHQGRC